MAGGAVIHKLAPLRCVAAGPLRSLMNNCETDIGAAQDFARVGRVHRRFWPILQSSIAGWGRVSVPNWFCPKRESLERRAQRGQRFGR
jgi:hypothetical protein